MVSYASLDLGAKSSHVGRTTHPRKTSAHSCSGSGAAAFLANSYNNIAAGAESSVIGGSGNSVCDDTSSIGGGVRNLVNSGNDGASLSFVGAGAFNSVSSDAFAAVIGGGSNNLESSPLSEIIGGADNIVTTTKYGVIGAGNGNSDTAWASTVVGGEHNSIVASSEQDFDYRVIFGGKSNGLLGCGSCGNEVYPQFGVIGGGVSNSASNQEEVVAGGGGNVASGGDAMVPGGYHNVATGGSFAAGFGAFAAAGGSFVWADDSVVKHLVSSAKGQFAVRASGGVQLFSNAEATTGVTLFPGSGAWSSSSDRNLKTDVQSIDNSTLLRALALLSITRWSYKAEPAVRHVGPMAQDFYRSFRVGEDDRHVATIDEGGVAIAALRPLAVEERTEESRLAFLYPALREALVKHGPLQPEPLPDDFSRTDNRPRSASDCMGAGANSFLANTQFNVAAGSATSVLGGVSNNACDDGSAIGGGTGNSVNSGADSAVDSFVGGGEQNMATSQDTFVGGGEATSASGEDSAAAGDYYNTVQNGPASLVLGGQGNFINAATMSAIGGGDGNELTSANETGGASFSTIGGGFQNSLTAASNNGASEGFIGGGDFNSVTGQGAVILGGGTNRAVGFLSMIPGGSSNTTLGTLSFAAGFKAVASGNGSFAWSPGGGGLNAGTNEFLADAPGGVVFYSNAAETTGAVIAAGSGTWSSASDSSLKINFRSVDDDGILANAVRMPVSTWSYVSERGVRHIGPMAQDFFSAARVGEDDRHISTIDEDGFALVAVKALHARLKLLSADYDALDSVVRTLQSKHVSLGGGSPGRIGNRSRRFRLPFSECTGTGAGSFLANSQGNVAAGTQATVAGGTDNVVCDDDSTIAGGIGNTIASGNDSGRYSFIGAGSNNMIASEESFIGAGSNNEIITSPAAAIVAGTDNVISGSAGAFIGAGSANVVASAPNGVILSGHGNVITAVNGGKQEANGALDSVIAGGYENTIAAQAASGASYSFIGGGSDNQVTGALAVVGGGIDNTASGEASTVLGGYQNVAAGEFSFAAGYQAHAMTPGSFVWADYSPGAAPLTSTKPNQFLVRASGGVAFFTNVGETAGVRLAPGSGSWSSVSDRDAKRDFGAVDGENVLRHLEALTVTEWSYRSEPGVRHLGPTAQDFYAAFRVGEDDRHIATIDEDGITLAAVKAIESELAALTSRRIALSRALSKLDDE